MEDLKLKMSGFFVYEQDGKKTGIMKVSIDGKIFTVHSTEVIPEARGKGIAGKLFDRMIEFVKKNDLELISECSYVDARLQKKRGEYGSLRARQ